MYNTHQIKQRELPAQLPGVLSHLHPVLARIYAGRKIEQAEQLEYDLNKLLPYPQLKDIDKAVSLLSEALQQQQRVLIVGDFDADGATSTALAMQALRQMGLQHVDYLVPNRFEYGYGLTPEIVALADRRRPDLIITVDNGISSIQGVAAAKQLGIRVLVTDHHLAAETLPEADAIVDPNQPGDNFPSKNLPGVGVIFYVMMALRAHLRDTGWFETHNQPNLAQLLDLVALGTVADVVPLDHNNRILVSQGLARIRAGQVRPGIQALLELSKKEASTLVASDFGFFVAPRINAAGRLEDMSVGIECLLAENINHARTLAAQLDSLNRQRRAIEAEMKEQALALLDDMMPDDEDDNLPYGLCLFEEDWHEGVVGILASRIKDRLHRPVIAFASSGNGQIKGSARSVKGLHIRDALDAVAAQHPELISRFGGHAMAAGLSLPRENFADFARAFDTEVRRHLNKEQLRGVLISDGGLKQDELGLELAELLRQAGPWGQGFDEPLFDGVFNLVQRRIVAEKHLKLVLQVAGSEQLIDAIAFNITDHDWPTNVDQVELAYRLDVNEYRGRRNSQLICQYVQPIPA